MRHLLHCAALLLLAAAACAQEALLDPDKPQQNPTIPTITFEYALPGAMPAHYTLALQSTGTAAYRSDSPQREGADLATPSHEVIGDPYLLRFVVSQPTRERLFQIAQQLHYFSGKYDYTKSRIANMGAKKLTYADATRHFQTSYNWSQNPLIDELTKICGNLSTTLEFGRKLDASYRHSKLALDEVLKQMDEAAKSNGLVEVQIIQPILQRIANDPTVLHIARERAQRILDKLPEASESAPTTPTPKPQNRPFS